MCSSRQYIHSTVTHNYYMVVSSALLKERINFAYLYLHISVKHFMSPLSSANISFSDRKVLMSQFGVPFMMVTKVKGR